MPQIGDKERYFELIRDFEFVPFTQSEGWHNYNLSLKPGSICYFADDDTNPQAACFGHVKRLMGLKLLIIEGECSRKISQNPKEVTALLECIRQSGFDFVEMDSYSIYSAAYEIGARKAGFRRPVGLFSTPMSLLVHTDEPISYNRNWSRNLAKAKDTVLNVYEIKHPTTDVLTSFLHVYNEMCEFKHFRYHITISQLEALFSDPSMTLFVLENSRKKAIGYRAIHTHGAYATDVFAANSPKDMEQGATHHFVANILEILKAKGVARFDFARVLYGNKELEKVAQFKSGIKGKYILYNGEWAWYKHACYRPMMYLVKRFWMKRIEV